MRGIRYLGDRGIAPYDYPDLEPGPGEVKLQVRFASVCGTDLHKYSVAPSAVAKRPDGTPEIPGHEAAGTVAALGPGVEGLSLGARALLAGVIGCGACQTCRSGFNTACERGVCGLNWNHHGVDATHCIMPARNIIELPDAVSYETAVVLTCAGGTAYTSLAEVAATGEDRVAVLGLGPVGLCTVIFAKALGAQVIGIDLADSRLALAEAVGADAVVNAEKSDAVAEVKRWSQGRGADVVIECVGKAATKQQSLELCAVRGRVAMAGLGAEPIPLDVSASLIGRQLSVHGVAATPIRYFPRMLRLTAERGLPFEKLVTHRMPLDRAAEAYGLMEEAQSGKVMLEVS